MKAAIRPAARADILRQFRYYLVDNGAEAAAERFLVAIQETIDLLCREPGIGAPRALGPASLSGLRTWPVKGFPSHPNLLLVRFGADSDHTGASRETRH